MRAQSIIASLITTPDVLRAVLVSNARGFSCASLSAELRRSRCRDCNGDDVDVYLITGVVVCRSAGWPATRCKYSPLTWRNVLVLAETAGTTLSVLKELSTNHGSPGRVCGGNYSCSLVSMMVRRWSVGSWLKVARQEIKFQRGCTSVPGKPMTGGGQAIVPFVSRPS